jgi:hypothetical protein
MKIGRGNRSTRRKPAPAPLCPPQIPLDQTPGSNPGRRVGKPATNRLSYGAAWTLRKLFSFGDIVTWVWCDVRNIIILVGMAAAIFCVVLCLGNFGNIVTRFYFEMLQKRGRNILAIGSIDASEWLSYAYFNWYVLVWFQSRGLLRWSSALTRMHMKS